MDNYTPPSGDQANFVVQRLIEIPLSNKANFNTTHMLGTAYNSYTNIVGYITPSQQASDDISALARSAAREENSFTATIAQDTTYQIYQVFTKDEYVYAASGRGLSIFDLNSGELLYIKDIPGAITKTVWGNDTTLYIGGNNGLLEVEYIDLHIDYINCVLQNSFILDSSNIKYIHGKNSQLLVCTSSGVEYFDYSGNPSIRSKTYMTNVVKCFMTDEKAYYINYNTVSGVTTYNLNRRDNLKADWEMPSLVYSTGDGIFGPDIYLTDIFVTEHTSLGGENTVFCTTSSGVYVVDEYSLEYATYYTG